MRDNATTSHDRDRKLRGVFAADRDVNERKRYEQSLQEADRRKNEFLAMLVHELRNPLAPMRNALLGSLMSNSWPMLKSVPMHTEMPATR